MAHLDRYTTMSATENVCSTYDALCKLFTLATVIDTTSHVWCRSALETAVHTSVQKVDDAVLKSSEQQTSSGTTAVLALAFHQQILLAHLGDSKAVLCQHVQQCYAVKQADKPNLRAVPLTIDHSPDRPDERARIDAAGGTISIATVGEQPTQTDCCAAPCSSVHAGMRITHSCSIHG